MRPSRTLLAGLLLTVAVPATVPATQVYRSVGPDGTVLYSDQPGPDSQEVDVGQPAAIVSSPVPTKTAPTRSPPEPEKAVVYTTLRITQPANDAVHWFAEGPLPVEVQVVPPLAEGHVIVPILDGVAQGKGVTASRFTLTGLDPNTYQLAVAIHDADGKELKRSPPIRFHFKRQSLNLPARRAPVGGH